ncbi:MAG: pilus assembly protein N-terminal domain-containing protein [Pseudomonadota bacterium]
MIRTALASILAAALAAIAGAGALAHDRTHTVTADQASLLRLPGDAAAIVIGNPSIADATLYDARTIFVTGKLFGRTNIIALDGSGRVIHTADVVVTKSDRNSLTVFRNTEQRSFDCAPRCQASPQVGDGTDWFEDRSAQQAARMGTAEAGGADPN